jgi:hypothetical protein
VRTGLLATAFLTLLTLSGYVIWKLVWNAFYRPGRPEIDSSEYVVAVGRLAFVGLVALWLTYQVGRRIRANVNANFAKPSLGGGG